ncbi:MAG: type II secretion system F family protein [Gallionella sp.]|nr:type II secretion system F family protein [Gallionella sp.]MDD4960368.1 type II secretion system F family protein [Gallionella sp.]
MPSFAYKGRNARGDLVQGVMTGDDSGAVADQLINIGITPIEINISLKTASTATHQPNWFQTLSKGKPVSQLDLMLFSRQMYTLLKAGVPILRALAGLQESSPNPTFSLILQDLRDSLDSGRELSAALRRHPKIFSPFYVSMVHVGEMTGMLDETFLRLYGHLEFERDMRERIKAAVRYPIFVVIAISVAIVIINIFVLPTFAKVFEGFHAELPNMTKLLLGFSAFMVHYWFLMALLIVGLVLGFRFYTNTVDGRYKWDRYKFKLPIVGGLILKSTLARFARSLALSFKSGMPITQGMSVVGMVVDNEFMRSRIEQMRDGIERGESILRTAVAAGVFNSVVLQMIAVGEETGDMDGLMFEIADMYEREVKYEVANLSSQIEPILIVGLGVLVLILALGVFLPMWDLGKAAMHR